MNLDELIAAERRAPPTPTTAQARAGWSQLKANAGAAVPAAFDIAPAAAKVGLSTKVAAAFATTAGKVVVGVGLIGAVATGVAVGRGEPPASAPVAVASSPRAPAKERPPAAAPVDAPVVVETASAPAPDAVAVEPVEPVVEDVVTGEAAVVEAPVTPKATPAKRATKKPAPAEDAAATGSFHDELALIRKAQSALAGGRHDEALAALADHAERFPRGSMKEDRLALRALVLCAAGRVESGTAAAETFRKSYARSLYAKRVDEACP